MDNLRAFKLKIAMGAIPNRTLKDTIERVQGQGNKILGMLKNLDNHFKKLPRDALRQWKDYVEKIKAGSLLDSLRAQKLKFAMQKIPLRICKDAT